MEIPLTQHRSALISDDDFDLIKDHKWQAVERRHTWYAATTIDGKRVYMHRLILDPAHADLSDHIDGDGLNNKRSNLRIATREENNRNARPRRGGSSKYKGVSFAKGRKASWAVSFGTGKDRVHIGHFATEIEAARAYDEAAEAAWGEYAYLNRDHFEDHALCWS